MFKTCFNITHTIHTHPLLFKHRKLSKLKSLIFLYLHIFQGVYLDFSSCSCPSLPTFHLSHTTSSSGPKFSIVLAFDLRLPVFWILNLNIYT